jgi:hypothetical protein
VKAADRLAVVKTGKNDAAEQSARMKGHDERSRLSRLL